MKNKVGLILNAGLTATRLYRGWLKQTGAADKVVIKLLDYEKIRAAVDYSPITGPTPVLEEKIAEFSKEGCTHVAIGCFSVQEHMEELCRKYKLNHIDASGVLMEAVHRTRASSPFGMLGTHSTRFFGTLNSIVTCAWRKRMVWPRMRHQLNHDILYRMSRYAPDSKDYELITECTKDLIAQGAKTIIVGCTDISEACPKAFDGTRFIDVPFLYAKEIARVANE
jgi:aspartate/glutamate racemase